MVVLYQNGISKAKLAVPMSMFVYAAQGCYWKVNVHRPSNNI
jgi:hypothetical protein